MIKRIILSILGILILFAAIAGIKALQIQSMIEAGANFQMPPEVVTTASVETQSWESNVSAIASFKAIQGVTIRSELAGKITAIGFEAGTRVEKGDLLVQQDVATERAQLRSAEASVALAKTRLERSRRLLAQRTVPQSDFDTADANYKQAVAQADEIRTVIEKKTVRAPFSGRLGIRLVNLGEVLAGGQEIVSLQSLDPIYAEFSLPQKVAPRNPGQEIRLETDAVPGVVAEGKISVVDPMANEQTRSVRMQATVPNPGEKFLPGMFSKVTVVRDQPKEVLAVPSTAVMFAPYGDSVFVIEEAAGEDGASKGLVARQQLVILGERRGDFVAVTKGLKIGDVVASSAVFKLRNGISVIVNNDLAPESQLDPNPVDN